MEKENKEESAAVQGAEAQKTEGTAAAFGKFKSADALLNAYNSLEAEFTRRSQRLRELEERETHAAAEPTVTDGNKESLQSEVRRAVDEYLSRERPPFIMAEGGAFSAAPVRRVQTLEQAGAQTEEMFKKNV